MHDRELQLPRALFHRDPVARGTESLLAADAGEVVRHLLRTFPAAVNIIVRDGEDAIVDDVGGLTRLTLMAPDGSPWRATREELGAFALSLYGQDWDTAMRRRALDVGLSLTLADWCRVNACFVHGNGIQFVIRRHPSEPLSLADIGAPPELATLSEEPRGLILFVGRTGAGKSTTLAAVIKHINQRQARHIVRIEDPHEIPVAPDRSFITVREVGHDVDSADLAVVDALRQAPDVICVSEVRTRETAAALFDAADAGHLCMATVHGPNPVDAVARFCGFFGPEAGTRAKLLSSVLLAVVGQVRLPRVDGNGYKAFFESLIPGPPQSDTRKLVEEAKWAELRGRLNSRALPQSTPLADGLARAVRDGVVSRQVAELHAFDRQAFLRALETQK